MKLSYTVPALAAISAGMDEELDDWQRDWSNPDKGNGTNKRGENVFTLENHGYWQEEAARAGNDNIIVRISVDDASFDTPWRRREMTRGDGSTQDEFASGSVIRTYEGNDSLTLCLSENTTRNGAWTRGYRAGEHDNFMIYAHMAVGHNPPADEFDRVTVKYFGSKLQDGYVEIDPEEGITFQQGNRKAIGYDAETGALAVMPQGIPLLSITGADSVTFERIESAEEFSQCFGAYSDTMLVSDAGVSETVDASPATARSNTRHTQTVVKQG